MVLQLVLFTVFLLLLFFISRSITNQLYAVFYLLTRSDRISIYLLSCLLLFGTIIHELSHLFVALLIRVPTGQLTVFPKIEKTGQGREVRAGRLMIADTDPFRHTIIGLAPMIVGIFFIYLIGFYFFQNISVFQPSSYNIQPLNLIGVFFLFSISVSMFSSRRDIESAIIVIPAVLLIFTTLYLIGIRILLDPQLTDKVTIVLTHVNGYLALSLIFDYGILALLFIVTAILQKIFRIRIF